MSSAHTSFAGYSFHGILPVFLAIISFVSSGCHNMPTLINRSSTGTNGTITTQGAINTGIDPVNQALLLATEKEVKDRADLVYGEYDQEYDYLLGLTGKRGKARLARVATGSGMGVASVMLTTANAAANATLISGLSSAAGALVAYEGANAEEGFTSSAAQRRLASLVSRFETPWNSYSTALQEAERLMGSSTDLGAINGKFYEARGYLDMARFAISAESELRGTAEEIAAARKAAEDARKLASDMGKTMIVAQINSALAMQNAAKTIEEAKLTIVEAKLTQATTDLAKDPTRADLQQQVTDLKTSKASLEARISHIQDLIDQLTVRLAA